MPATAATALSRREAAEALGLSLYGIDALIKEKKLRVKHRGRRVLVPQSEINRYLETDDDDK